MSDELWEDPAVKVWVNHVLDEMVPKLEGSALVISLVPESREGDVKFWVELGASIMMEKPIIALVMGDAPVPAKLLAIADEVVYCPSGINALASSDLEAAIKRVVESDRPMRDG